MTCNSGKLSHETEAAQALRTKKARASSSTKKAFVDSTIVKVYAGDGGNGAINMLSLFANEFAGPAGGNGGNGGHVIFKASKAVSSLGHLGRTIMGNPGVKGGKTNCDGKNGLHKVVSVPLGTVFKNPENRHVLAELTSEGQLFLAAKGGAGGKGNAHFKAAENQTPRVAEAGGEGEKFQFLVELSTMADVGFLGFPNAGKSTLLRAISRARPKVAGYPFTTLRVHIGMVPYDDGVQLAVADIPGIIAGAHKNEGLGISFLRHVERCACLLYIIDVARADAFEQLEALQFELGQYRSDLPSRPRAIVANKMDAEDSERNLEDFKVQLSQSSDFNGLPLFGVSGKYGTNIASLLQYVRLQYDASQPQQQDDSELDSEESHGGCPRPI